jgi:hypothetical protein
MPLNRCPPEICSQIFMLACTDGGYTGRSLAEVSRYIRETSNPYKFQSIALSNAHQASSFASILGRTTPCFRGVTYLFVSNDEPTIDRLESHGEGTKRSSNRSISSFVAGFAKLSPRTVKPVKEAPDLDIEMVESLLRILTIVAPTLRTLSISFECRWIRPPSLASVGTGFPVLPSLTELSLNYRAPTDALFNYYLHHFPGSFPSLRRLDISGVKLLSYHFQQYGCITQIAPFLTHLHLPAKMAITLVLTVLWQPTPTTPDDDYLPVTLKRVLLELNGPHASTCQGSAHLQPQCIRCRLLNIATTDVKFVALEPRSDDTWRKNRERLEDEWRDRISGGEGGWDERNAVHE